MISNENYASSNSTDVSSTSPSNWIR